MCILQLLIWAVLPTVWLLSAAAASQITQAGPVGIARFGAAGHFAYQVPYGRDNQPWAPWPINTTEQLRVLKAACGGGRSKRQCVYKTDFPCGPAVFNTTLNESDIHVGYMQILARQAAALGIEVMGAMGIGSDWGVPTAGGVDAEEFGRRIARAMTGVTHWQMSDEWAVPHCMLPRVDYKRHWGMEKADYNASCMISWCATMSAVIRGIHSVTPDAVTMPVAMGWTRLGIWNWIADERVPLDAIGLDWYSDGGDINCTCTEYPPLKCGQAGHKPCVNFLELLAALLPNKPVWITEMNRKLGSCNGTAVVQPPGTVCGKCSQDDNCKQGLSDQAAYVGSALAKYGVWQF